MKLTIRCERCDTTIREHDLPKVDGANIAVAPCPNCVKNNDGEILKLRVEKLDALRSAQAAVREVHDHRARLHTALELAQRCVDLNIPPAPHDDVPFDGGRHGY